MIAGDVESEGVLIVAFLVGRARSLGSGANPVGAAVLIQARALGEETPCTEAVKRLRAAARPTRGRPVAADVAAALSAAAGALEAGEHVS